jgi:uncharacterized iron-regulated membrane protein
MKKIISWLHLWLGIGSGLVILVVALSGSLLVFEEELELLFRPSFYYVQPQGREKLSADVLTANIQDHYKGYTIKRITVEPEAGRTTLFYIQQKKGPLLTVAADPYTGRVIKTIQTERSFFYVVLQLHRYLCMGTTGKAITGVACCIFLLMVVTGLVLWWPKRNNRRQRFRIKWNASFKRFNWDLHAVLGFYVHLFIFLIALTGLVWSYKWVNDLLFYAFDGKPAQKREAPATPPAPKTLYLDKILAQTSRQLPYHGPVDIRFPEIKGRAIQVSKLNKDAAISNVVSFLYFQGGNGALVSKRLYEEESKGMKARRLVYPIHTGSIYGWPTKLLALICSLVAASLPITGLYVWLNRKKKKPVPRKPQPLPEDLRIFPVEVS